MENSHHLKNSLQNRKSGQKVANASDGDFSSENASGAQIAVNAKVAKSRAASTHGQFASLRTRIQKNTASYFGARTVSTYVIRLQSRDVRGWFELGADLDEAVKRAREIIHHVSVHGWADARMRFAFTRTDVVAFAVADYFEVVVAHGQLNRGTLVEYQGRFRQVVAGVMGIEMAPSEKLPTKGGVSKWRAKVDATPLFLITPAKVIQWRDARFNSVDTDPAVRRSATHTLNGVIRNGRSLFSKRLLQRLGQARPNLGLPSPLPFEGVHLLPERESDYFYRSEINVRTLIADAMTELSGNQLVIFCLALGAGLRRAEIDRLLWRNVDLASGRVSIVSTDSHELKTESSTGILVLEPQFVDVIKRHASVSKGKYVLVGTEKIRDDVGYRWYRCPKDFEHVTAWLKGKGINDEKGVHTLRKEFGSHHAERGGILAASVALRHSTLTVTRKFYVSAKPAITSFFPPEKVPTPKKAELTLADLLVEA